MQGKVPIVSRDKCRHWQSYGNRITPNMVCGGLRQGGIDACQGDSGGPFVCKNPQNPKQWTLVGVTSWGKGCARALKYGVYANVTRYLHWINFLTGNQPTSSPGPTTESAMNGLTLPPLPGGGKVPTLPPLPGGIGDQIPTLPPLPGSGGVNKPTLPPLPGGGGGTKPTLPPLPGGDNKPTLPPLPSAFR